MIRQRNVNGQKRRRSFLGVASRIPPISNGSTLKNSRVQREIPHLLSHRGRDVHVIAAVISRAIASLWVWSETSGVSLPVSQGKLTMAIFVAAPVIGPLRFETNSFAVSGRAPDPRRPPEAGTGCHVPPVNSSPFADPRETRVEARSVTLRSLPLGNRPNL